MRRHFDEDETPAATRRRNKAADARHGFGSPEGMELTDRAAEQLQQQQAVSSQPRSPYSRNLYEEEKPSFEREYDALLALADLESPPPPILTMSTESETPTPPAAGQTDRQTPPDAANPNFADQLVGRGAASPPVDTPALGAIRPPRRPGDATFQQQSTRLFVSPTPSNISATSSTQNFTSTPSFRPQSYASPMALQALRSSSSRGTAPRTGQSVGSFDPIQMGTPRSAAASATRTRFSDVTMTPDAARGRQSYGDDSASDSDSSVSERFSDQVETLNTLLLSTGKRLGPLGKTSFSPDKDNDDLTQEEEDLEEIRRELQRELSMVDYSILKDSPGSTPSRRSRYGGDFPDDEPSPLRSQASTPSQSKRLETPKMSAERTQSRSRSHRRNVMGAPLTQLVSSAQKKLESDPKFSSSSSSSSRTPSQSSPSTSQAKSPSSPPQRRTTPPTKPIVSPPEWSPWTTEESLTTAQYSSRKRSPPSNVYSSPHSRSLSSPKSSPMPWSPKEDSVSSPPSVRAAQRQGAEDAATEVSHETSFQSSSSSSGSSAQSSKSLLERFGFRKSTVPGLQGVKEEANVAAGEREDNSGYFSSSVASTSFDDRISTSASEDSGFDSYGYMDKGKKPLLSPNQTRSESLRITPVSAQAQVIERLEEQLDSPENMLDMLKSSQVVRHEIAPEPPETDSKTLIQPQQTQPSTSPKRDYRVGTLRTQELLDSLDKLFSSGGHAPPQEDKADTTLLPNTVARSDTVSFADSGSLAFPSDERKFPRENLPPSYRKENRPPPQSPATTVSMAIRGDDGDMAGYRRFPSPKAGRLGSQSSIGSAKYPSDERDTIEYQRSTKNEVRANSQSSIGASSSSFPSHERGNSPWSKSGPKGAKKFDSASSESVGELGQVDQTSPEQDSTGTSTPVGRSSSNRKNTAWLLQTIGSIGSPGGQSLSPIVHEDEDLEKGVGTAFLSSDSPSKTLFFYGDDEPMESDSNRLAVSDSKGDGDGSEKEGTDTDFRKQSTSRFRRNICCLIFLLLVVGAFFLGLWKLGILDRSARSTLSNAATSTSNMPSSAPTKATPAPSISAAPTLAPPVNLAPSRSPSISPSLSPTIFTISFETVYEIVVHNGLVQDVPQQAYENDLIESMDRLLQTVEKAFPGAGGNRRRLIAVKLPSSIDRFAEAPCPTSNGKDRCQSVFAYITLQDAKENWADFEIKLELAIATGHLQSELNRVNPNSPVAIIDLIGESPTPSPLSEFPTNAPTVKKTATPTHFDLMGFLAAKSFDNGRALMTEGTPQYLAYLWLLQDSSNSNYTAERLLQRYVMATFYYSTHGDSWFFNISWLSEKDECLWYSRSSGSPCNRQGQLQNLELDYNNVDGNLPPELGLLSDSLDSLILRGGPVSFSVGPIPSELGYLTNMNFFFISSNQYSGSIPSELGRWTALQQFDVSKNGLTGPIPTDFGRFVDLNLADFSSNKISGNLPTEIGNWIRCQKFIIEDNLLSGPIPSEIGNLRRLQSFQGGSNMFTSIPTELGRLTFLDTLSLFENNLEGTIPSELSGILRLILLDLSNNGLSGPIPSELGSLFDMRDRIDLSFNHLTGQIPTELGNLDRLRLLDFQHNKLSGTIPPEFSALSRLTTIRIDSNNLIGTIPLQVCTTFNQTLPAFYGDCSEFSDGCPCCTSCCVDGGSCNCRYLGTPEEFLCFQQKKAI